MIKTVEDVNIETRTTEREDGLVNLDIVLTGDKDQIEKMAKRINDLALKMGLNAQLVVIKDVNDVDKKSTE